MHWYRSLSTLIVVLGLLDSASAEAAFLDFVAAPQGGHADSVSLGSSGQVLAGSDIALTTLFGVGTPNVPGQSFALGDARLDFTTGALIGTDASGDLFFGPGGNLTITITSAAGGVPTGVAFTGQFTGTTELKKEADGTFHILAGASRGPSPTPWPPSSAWRPSRRRSGLSP